MSRVQASVSARISRVRRKPPKIPLEEGSGRSAAGVDSVVMANTSRPGELPLRLIRATGSTHHRRMADPVAASEIKTTLGLGAAHAPGTLLHSAHSASLSSLCFTPLTLLHSAHSASLRSVIV